MDLVYLRITEVSKEGGLSLGWCLDLLLSIPQFERLIARLCFCFLVDIMGFVIARPLEDCSISTTAKMLLFSSIYITFSRLEMRNLG